MTTADPSRAGTDGRSASPDRAVPPAARDTAEIISRGNDERCLRLLLAQRRLYQSAKRYAGGRLSGITLFAFTAPIITAVYSSTAAWWGAAAGVWALATRGLRQAQHHDVGLAVRAQDEIDRVVFGLEPNRAISWLDPTEVASRTEGDLDEQVRSERLRDWYDTIPTGLAGPLAVVIGQFSNVSYSRRLQARQQTLLLRLGLLLTAAVVGVPVVAQLAWHAEFTFLDWLVGAALPALPAGLEAIDGWAEHRGSIHRLCELEKEIDTHLSTVTGPPSIDRATVWQDALYADRRNSPLVFDILYRRGRKQDGAAVGAAVATLFARYQVRNRA
jgi:hypothetical protein